MKSILKTTTRDENCTKVTSNVQQSIFIVNRTRTIPTNHLQDLNNCEKKNFTNRRNTFPKDPLKVITNSQAAAEICFSSAQKQMAECASDCYDSSTSIKRSETDGVCETDRDCVKSGGDTQREKL